MGLDGGTIVSRSDVLRGQSWRVAQNDTSRSTRGGSVSRVPQETTDKALERSTAWSTCALSSQPLLPPIVACGLGRLYNKDAVVQFLLAKKGKASSPASLLAYANQLRVAAGGLDHITSLRDVLEVHLQPAEDDRRGARFTPAAAGGAPTAAGIAQARGAGGGEVSGPAFVCPITLLPCDRHSCSALRPCGHVLSDRALANMHVGRVGGGDRGGEGGDSSCPVCGEAYTSTLPIHGSPEQVQALQDQLRAAATAAAAAAAKGAKTTSGKKRKAAEAADEATAPSS